MPSRRTFLAGAAGALSLSTRAAGQSTATPPSRTWSRTYDTVDHSVVGDLVPSGDGYALVGSVGTEAAVRGWVAGVDAEGQSPNPVTLGDAGTRLVAGAPAEGGVLAVGTTNVREQPGDRHRDPYAARVGTGDAQGPATRWARSYQPAIPDGGATAIAPVDGGYVIAGAATTAPESDGLPWAAGIDAAGTQHWTWQGDPAGTVTDAVATAEGVVLVGSSGDPERAWAVALDSTGSRRWGWMDESDDDSRLAAAAPAPAGGVLAVGRRGFEPSRGTGWLASLGPEGRRWQRTDDREEWNWHRDIAALDDGYVLAGTIGDVNAGERSAWLLRIDADGELRWERRADDGTEAFAVRPSADGGILLAGSADDGDGERAWLAKFGGDGGGSGVSAPSMPEVPGWAAPLGVGAAVGATGTALARQLRTDADEDG